MGRLLLVGTSADAERETHALEMAGHTVFLADSATEALGIHRREKTQVLVCDLDVGDTPAERLVAAIRVDSEMRHVAIIVVSREDDAEVRRAADCGANAVLPRSLVASRLPEMVTHYLAVPPRAPYRVLLRVEVPEQEHPRRSFFCTSHDISRSGVRIDTPETLEKGQMVKCSFFLPGGVRAVATGEIVRVAQEDEDGGIHHYGLRWLGLDAEAVEAIETFIARRAMPRR